MFIPILFGWWFWEKFCKTKLAFPNFTGGLIALLIYAEGVGSTFGFYGKFGWYDQITHFIGGVTIGLISCLIINDSDKKHHWNLNSKFLIIFSLCLTLSLCVIWEFYEYFVDSLKNTNLIADKFDTSNDLLFNFIGAVPAIIISALVLKRINLTEKSSQ